MKAGRLPSCKPDSGSINHTLIKAFDVDDLADLFAPDPVEVAEPAVFVFAVLTFLNAAAADFDLVSAF